MSEFKNFVENQDQFKNLKFIRRGLELRPDNKGGRTFWDDFTDLISSNPDLASELLEIPREKVSKLRKEISNLVEKAKDEDRMDRGKNTIV